MANSQRVFHCVSFDLCESVCVCMCVDDLQVFLLPVCLTVCLFVWRCQAAPAGKKWQQIHYGCCLCRCRCRCSLLPQLMISGICRAHARPAALEQLTKCVCAASKLLLCHAPTHCNMLLPLLLLWLLLLLSLWLWLPFDSQLLATDDDYVASCSQLCSSACPLKRQIMGISLDWILYIAPTALHKLPTQKAAIYREFLFRFSLMLFLFGLNNLLPIGSIKMTLLFLLVLLILVLIVFHQIKFNCRCIFIYAFN